MGFASGRFLFAFADIVANSLPLPCTTPWIVSFFFWLWFPVLQRRARFREFKGKRVVDLQPRAGTNLFFLLLPSLFSPGALEHYDMCGHVPYCRTLPFIVQRECVVWAGPVLSNDAQAKYKAANLMSSIIINKDCLLSENYTVKTKSKCRKRWRRCRYSSSFLNWTLGWLSNAGTVQREGKSPEQWHREDKGKKMVFNWFLENASCCGVNDAVILGTQTPAAESPQLSTHTH